MTSEFEVLAQRLEQAEKQIAHLTSLMLGQDSDRTIVAKQFVVKDAQGVRRAELGMPGGETDVWLRLFDTDGNLRVHLGVNAEGSGLELCDAKSRKAVEVVVNEVGSEVCQFGKNGGCTLSMRTVEDGPVLALLDPNGKARLTMFVSSSSLNGDGGFLVMQDANLEIVLKLAVESNGKCLVFSKDNRVVWSAP